MQFHLCLRQRSKAPTPLTYTTRQHLRRRLHRNTAPTSTHTHTAHRNTYTAHVTYTLLFYFLLFFSRGWAAGGRRDAPLCGFHACRSVLAVAPCKFRAASLTLCGDVWKRSRCGTVRIFNVVGKPFAASVSKRSRCGAVQIFNVAGMCLAHGRLVSAGAFWECCLESTTLSQVAAMARRAF